MSIRLVNDAGEIYWFTSSNWRMVRAFASLHGWASPRMLDPSNWDEALPWNDNYEIIGGASLSQEESRAFAEAIAGGICDDPTGTSVVNELERRASEMRKKLPEYDPLRHAADLLEEWSRFGEFARRGGLRVDLTD